MAAGPYWLSIGMYDLNSLKRLPLTDGRSGLSAEELRVGPIKVVGQAPSPSHSLDATFEGILGLTGFEFVPPAPGTGDTLRVSLYWRTMKKVTVDYKVFVHVLDGDGKLIAQHDGEALNGLYPFPQWEQSEEIRDDHNIRLPAEAVGQKLRIVAGIYDPATIQRLRLPDGRDSIDLGEFSLR